MNIFGFKKIFYCVSIKKSLVLLFLLVNTVAVFSATPYDNLETFSLTKYRQIPGIPFQVRPLVDEVSLSYRTGQPDPVLKEIPDSITKMVFRNPSEGIPKLVQFLKNNGGSAGASKNEYHLTKRIHDWITANLIYDTRKYSGTQDPLEFLVLKGGPVCVCRGFADLFAWMAKEGGLKARRVSGVCRTYWSYVGRYGRHAWNVVEINGKSYIVDGSGDSIHRLGVKDSRYKDSCLFASPEDNLIYYRADNEKDQLVENPVEYDAWLHMPLINRSFLKYGIAFKKDTKSERKIFEKKEGHRKNFYDIYTSKESIWEMDFIVQRGYEVSVSFLDKHKNKIPVHAIVKYHKNSNGTYLNKIQISPPKAGQYIVNVYGKDHIHKKSHIIYTFYLDHIESRGTMLPAPLKFTPNMRFEKYSFKASDMRQVGNRYAFDIKYNPEDQIVVSAKTLDGKAYSGRFYFVQTGKYSRTYYFSPPSKGIWAVWLYNKRKGTKDNLDRVGLYHVIAQRPEVVGIPYFTPNYKPLYFDRKVKLVQDMKPVKNSDRLYSVVLQMPESYEVRNYLLECDSKRAFLRDRNEKLIFAKGHYSYKRDGQLVTFYFSPGKAKSSSHTYRARIYLREGKQNKVILEYFIPAGRGPGTPVP